MLIFSLICACLTGVTNMLRLIVFGGMADMFIYDSRYANWLDDNWDNITMVFPNATVEEMQENPSFWMSVYIQDNQYYV